MKNLCLNSVYVQTRLCVCVVMFSISTVKCIVIIELLGPELNADPFCILYPQGGTIVTFNFKQYQQLGYTMA